MLNSSTLEFWFKQVCFPKGGTSASSGVPLVSENWEERYVRNGTNVILAPYDRSALEARLPIISQIESVLTNRRLSDPRVVIETAADDLVSALLRAALADEQALSRLVFLQEELDWLTYRTFGIADDVPILGVDEPRVLKRGDRPFEIALARRVSRGEEQTKWFDRHDTKPVTSIPADYDEAHRAVLEARLGRIECDETVGILEQPVYKRRWSQTGWDERVRLGGHSKCTSSGHLKMYQGSVATSKCTRPS